MDITIAIPTIPPRRDMLKRAVSSACMQLKPASAISIAIDSEKEGAWVTRTRAVAAVKTEWVALLDDDDQLDPDHLLKLSKFAQETKADYVYSWPRVVGGYNPLEGEMDDWKPGLQTTTTILVRTELAQQVGWQLPNPGELVGRNCAGEDYLFTMGCHEAGASIRHLIGEKTWTWHHHGSNTSGLPTHW